MLIVMQKNWILLLLFTSLASTNNLHDSLQARDLAIVSVNLNARLSWTINNNIVRSEGNYNFYQSELVTYTVEVDDIINYRYGWVPVPGCIRVKQLHCKLHVPDVAHHEYRVQTNLGNKSFTTSASYLYDFYNDPLLPPKFSVEIKHTNLLLQISEKQTVNWGNQSLFDHYYNDGILLQYKIEYWTMVEDNSLNSSRLKIKRKADAARFELPIERHSDNTVCVRLAVEEDIGTVKGKWSRPFCVSESTHDLHIMVAVLCVLFLVAIVVLTWIIRKRIHQFLKMVRLPLPKELAAVVEDLEKHETNYSSVSLKAEAECVTAYQSSQEANAQQVDDEKAGAMMLGETHSLVVVNKYVPMKGSNSAPSLPPALHSLVPTSGMILDDDVSDYVGIPSPDSGVEMMMNFELMY